MDLLLKYRFPLFETADPAGSGTDAPAPADPVVPDPAVPPSDGEHATPAPTAKAKLPDAVISEITSLRGQKRDLAAELERARRDAADARALAERLQRGSDKDAPATPRTPDVPVPDNAEIDRRADYKLFMRDVEALKQNGIREFGPAFNESVRILQAVGADDDGFVQSVMAVDRANAHALLNAIAQDPERAVALVGMQPAQRIAEITRMSIAMTASPAKEPTKDDGKQPAPAPPPKQISKAPAPAPAIDPGATKIKDWRQDDSSDEEFDRGFQEMMKTRHARR